MIKPKFNIALFISALIGVILYFSVNVLHNMNTRDFSETDSAYLTKKQASETAVSFLQAKYDGLRQPQTLVMYQSDKVLSGYLQKEKLGKLYDEAYGNRFAIDYYLVEVSEPAGYERYRVQVNMEQGTIRGWNKTSAAGKQDLQSAQKLAQLEISKQGHRIEEFTLLRQSMDGSTLIYQKTTDPDGKYQLRLKIVVEQNQVVGFTPSFSVPESYLAWQKRQDEAASSMTWISMGFTLLMTIAAIVYVRRLRFRINFRRGLALTAIVTILYIINNMNQYPAYKAMAGIESSQYELIVALVFYNLITLLLSLSLYVSLAAGNALWEQSGRPKWPSWQDSRFGNEVFYGMGRGYLLCFLIMGIQQVLFYAAETKFDMWSVNDPLDSPLNMLQPGIFPTLAWVAAISEEAAFRLFGIIWFKRLVKNDFLAVLLPSIIWAASHTQYPIYPVYTRLIEVTLLGIIFGYAFLKYGFITALFAHACMNSILMGLTLFWLNDATLALVGVGYILLPATIAYLLAWLHGKRRKPPTLGEPPPRPEAL